MTIAPTPHVYLTRALTDDAIAAARALGYPVLVGDAAAPPRERLLRDAAGAVAVVCTATERVDAEFLDAAGPALRVVATTAAGDGHIDVSAAAERGVRVTNTAGGLTEATADLTMALILATARLLRDDDRLLRGAAAREWGPRTPVGPDVAPGSTLGIVGYGRIGRAVARRAAGHGMTVIATPTGSPPTGEDPGAVAFVELPELLERADVVTLHCPSTPATRHLVDAAALRRMKRTAVLVSTAGGPVVDQAALAAALRDGEIAAAGLDAPEEAPEIHPGLLDAANAVLAAHLGRPATAVRERRCALAVAGAAAVLVGGDAGIRVN
ncbi:NAD(P)-dependent oxidoreductase [Marinactinospora rubrisoli]|uniref:NAD(P)-dependent oxidoreductase n=1 Tax=Marinactinospora rubrisoli TaxID=2715399 RepID=A0ABW2KNR9_9ACTN